jgi:hypothetical protein
MTTTITVIRAVGGYNVLQAFLIEGGSNFSRIISPAAPSKVFRHSSNPFPESILENGVWKDVQRVTLDITDEEDQSVLKTGDLPASVVTRARAQFCKWGVDTSVIPE